MTELEKITDWIAYNMELIIGICLALGFIWFGFFVHKDNEQREVYERMCLEQYKTPYYREVDGVIFCRKYDANTWERAND